MNNKVIELIAGVDEVGRGPLAGPVVTAAVILDPTKPIEGLADSKALTEKKRLALDAKIRENALAWSIGRCEVDEIDKHNILQATMIAMQRAVAGLSVTPGKVLVDGNRAPDFACPAETVIQGDKVEPAISAASIIAKVFRDNEMVMLDQQYPGYGLAKHKGYPTKQHIEALKVQGVSVIHRRSFGPVKKILETLG